MEKYTIGELLRYVVKRWWIVVVGIVFFAALLGLPKMQKTETEEATYQYSYSQLVKFNNHATYEDADNKSLRYQNYNDIWFRNSALSDFVKTISDNYNMTEIETTWDEMGNLQRADWIRSVFATSSVPNTPNYEVSLTLQAQEENNEYIQTHIEDLFRDFLQYMGKSVEIYEQDSANKASMELLSSMRSSITNEPDSVEEQGAINLKYFIVGGILGFLIGLFVVCVWFLTDKKVVSKSIYVKAYDVDTIDGAKRPAYDIACYMLLKAEKTGIHTMAVSSTMRDTGIVNEIANEFNKAGYTLKVKDLTDKNSEETPIISRNIEELEADRGQDDYQVVIVEAPSQDAGTVNLVLHCACSVFLEKLGKSPRKDLQNSIENIQKNKPDAWICIAWL